MISESVRRAYTAILREELVPAMGCTEPIAIAYAAARAREILGKFPDHAVVRCSGNMIKNVKGVTVPNTGGLKGIGVAAIAGIVGGKASRKLEVLAEIGADDLRVITSLLDSGYCDKELATDVDGLYIDVVVTAGSERARVVIEKNHTDIVRMERNNEVLFDAARADGGEASGTAPSHGDRSAYALLGVKDILEFAETVDLAELETLLSAQVRINSEIADAGLAGDYGLSVGKNLLKYAGTSVRVRARARAAAGSDARMGGCPLPVMINSGSGNQGLTVTLPVVEYAKELGLGKEKMLRALIISNLVALEQKEYIGKMSAFCGAVSASAGSAAAIAWMRGGGFREIAATVTNALACSGGILCDGAKASCAAKIATALEAALMAQDLAVGEKAQFAAGDGFLGKDVDETIRNVGRIGSTGMRGADEAIIDIMLKG